ncbi:MAG: flagellar brake protein [Oscillospiraceae bacterium]|nr:flagellar brake protein [Oscillospiraceae bacterium]
MIEVTKQAQDDIIVVGDKIDLVVQAGLVYRAMIEDRLKDGPFLVAVPTRRGVLMEVAQEDDIYLVFYRESGRYIAQMKVVAIERRGAARYMWILQKTKAQKNQRREAYRLPVSFNVQIFEYSEDTEEALAGGADEKAKVTALEKANSRDISVTGISLLTKKQFALEDKCILEMQVERTPAGIRFRELSNKTPPLYLTATVRRCIPWRTGNMFNTGMQFFGLTRNISEDLARYVLTEQQRQIKMRRRG